MLALAFYDVLCCLICHFCALHSMRKLPISQAFGASIASDYISCSSSFCTFSLSTRHCSRWISCICQTDCLCYDRSVQGIRPSCLSVVEVTSNLSGGSYTVNDKQGSTHPADWASYLKPRQRLRAVLTSSRHPPVAVVPPPGLGTPGRGFTAWYLSVFFYVLTFSLVPR